MASSTKLFTLNLRKQEVRLLSSAPKPTPKLSKIAPVFLSKIAPVFLSRIAPLIYHLRFIQYHINKKTYSSLVFTIEEITSRAF